MLPTSFVLSSDLGDIDPDPFALGDRADVYKGTLDGSAVCIKRMRVYRDNHMRTSQVRYHPSWVRHR
jgi:hypothetical protein